MDSQSDPVTTAAVQSTRPSPDLLTENEVVPAAEGTSWLPGVTTRSARASGPAAPKRTSASGPLLVQKTPASGDWPAAERTGTTSTGPDATEEAPVSKVASVVHEPAS